jgi:hypothetical protein
MTMRAFVKQLVGKRVILRQLRPTDAPDIYRYVKDPASRRWTLNIPYPYPLAGAAIFLRESA